MPKSNKDFIQAGKTKELPLRSDLGFLLVLSWIIVFLLAGSVLGGILFSEKVYAEDDVLMAFLPVDFFHLLFGLPLLVVSLVLTRKGNLAGLLCWPGVLLYILYSYTTNLLGVSFGFLFLPYLLLVVLSAYSILGIALAMDFEAIRERFSSRVPYKGAGIFLLVLTALFVLMAAGEIITTFIEGLEPGPLDTMLWIADLATISPMCLIGGVLLLKRHAIGYSAGAGLLLAYALLFLGLLPVMIFQGLYTSTAIDWTGLLMMFACGLFSLFYFFRFLRTLGNT